MDLVVNNMQLLLIILSGSLFVILLLVVIAYSRNKQKLTAQHLEFKLAEQNLEHQMQLNQGQQIQIEDLSLHNESLQIQVNKLTSRLRESDVRLQAGEQRLKDQQATEAKLSQQFEVLSQRIFQDKSTQFKQLNEQSIKQLLDPLSTQLEGFKKQVNDCYINESKERT